MIRTTCGGFNSRLDGAGREGPGLHRLWISTGSYSFKGGDRRQQGNDRKGVRQEEGLLTRRFVFRLHTIPAYGHMAPHLFSLECYLKRMSRRPASCPDGVGKTRPTSAKHIRGAARPAIRRTGFCGELSIRVSNKRQTRPKGICMRSFRTSSPHCHPGSSSRWRKTAACRSTSTATPPDSTTR